MSQPPSLLSQPPASRVEKASLELREKWKQIDTFLVAVQDIDVSRTSKTGGGKGGAGGGGGKKRAGDGSRVKDALTVANETRTKPFNYVRDFLTFDERRDFAQRGRSRVAPPLDHAGAVNQKLARRASVQMLRTGQGMLENVNGAQGLDKALPDGAGRLSTANLEGRSTAYPTRSDLDA